MNTSSQFRSGKGAGNENFPVASVFIRQRHRPIIKAFYEFVRVADDIADHPRLSADIKLHFLDRLEDSLIGKSNDEPEGILLGEKLREANVTEVHARELLQAFRQDVRKRRYHNWDELIGYCRLSAMPVGRFVLDVHRESRATWPASDALCTVLQIINHLQDCKSDYQALDRAYIPLDLLASADATVEEFGADRASRSLKSCLIAVADRTRELLDASRPLPKLVRDTRLAMEISGIRALAVRLTNILRTRDPLCEPTRISSRTMMVLGLRGALSELLRRSFFKTSRSKAPASSRSNAEVH